ncbi:MAG: Pvc16 family protein, partial [Pseudomonadota bacterium]
MACFKAGQHGVFKYPLYTFKEKLTVELVTLPFAQQNEIWNALRTTYRSSLLYKVRMVVFEQEEPVQKIPSIIEIV